MIERNPSQVRKPKKESYDGVSASFSPQSVSDLAIKSHFSIDSSLRLHKQPDHQDYLYNSLAYKKVVDYVKHQAIVIDKSNSKMIWQTRCHNHTNTKRSKCQ